MAGKRPKSLFLVNAITLWVICGVLEAGDVVLRYRFWIDGILRLLSGVNHTGSASWIEGRAWSTCSIARCNRRNLAGLVGLSRRPRTGCKCSLERNEKEPSYRYQQKADHYRPVVYLNHLDLLDHFKIPLDSEGSGNFDPPSGKNHRFRIAHNIYYANMPVLDFNHYNLRQLLFSSSTVITTFPLACPSER